MAMIASGEQAGYQISRSLRFNAPDSAYLTRTPGGAGNRKILAYRVRIKRAALGALQVLASAGTSSIDRFYFDASDRLCLDVLGSSRLVTTRVFRDPTAWLDVGFELDVANGTAALRAKILINETEATAYSTDGRSSIANSDTNWCNTVIQYIGRDNGGNYFSGYMAEPALVNGAKTITYSAVDALSGVRLPTLPAATWGTNGFYLDFSDNSNTTAATLGADRSGGGGNWTPTNFSVTAGAGNDSLTDTPTNYGTDTGLGGEVRGSFCTINPLRSGGSTVTDGNLRTVANVGAWQGTVGTLGMASGKWYWEVTQVAGGSVFVGICDSTAALNAWIGVASVWGIYNGTGQKTIAGAALAAYGATFTTNDVIGVALDMGAGTLVIYKNGVSQGTLASSLAGTLFPWGLVDTTSGLAYNFGQRPFAHTPPVDHKALCTHNLSAPEIPNPKSAFEAKLRTGTGGAASVTGLLFQPDLYIGKSRTATTDWAVYDSVRGVQKQVETNTTDAETTQAQGVTAFNSDGISIGTLAQINTSAEAYLDLFFKKGAAPGLDIVAYTGNGSNRTIAHALGAVPRLIIVFDLTTGGSHRTYHANMAASPQNGVIYLDGTAGYAAASTVWNSGAPTSAVFSVGTDVRVNTIGSSYVAMLFAEVPQFSRFGSWIGNGLNDGPYVFTGFRPAMVFHKRVDDVANWNMLDNLRDGFNPNNDPLFPNLTAIEGSPPTVDFLAHGFKLRENGAARNASGATYVYAAFAAQAGKYARAA
jgi:hypothetical protein